MTATLRLATVWLAGCSGCHMSFLDLDEALFDLMEQVEIVFSPVLIDTKTYPENVDVVLVEGAVANRDNLAMALTVRARSRLVISFGDCAVTANVPGLRNLLNSPERGDAEAGTAADGAAAVLERGYHDLADGRSRLPQADQILPALLPRVLPLHEVIAVDLHLPGCPPAASRIAAVLQALIEGRQPLLQGEAMLRFG